MQLTGVDNADRYCLYYAHSTTQTAGDCHVVKQVCLDYGFYLPARDCVADPLDLSGCDATESEVLGCYATLANAIDSLTWSTTRTAVPPPCFSQLEDRCPILFSAEPTEACQYCLGTPYPCASFHDPGSCAVQNGCYWTH